MEESCFAESPQVGLSDIASEHSKARAKLMAAAHKFFSYKYYFKNIYHQFSFFLKSQSKLLVNIDLNWKTRGSKDTI